MIFSPGARYEALRVSESAWSSVAPTTTKIQEVFDTLLEKIKTDVIFYYHHLTFSVKLSL